MMALNRIQMGLVTGLALSAGIISEAFAAPSVVRDHNHILWDCTHIVIELTGPEKAQVGDRITYRMSVANEGICALTGASFTDYIPRRSVFVAATPSPSSAPDQQLPDPTALRPAETVAKVNWERMELPPGSMREFEVEVQVIGPPDRYMLNSACFENPEAGRICSSLETWVVQ